LLLFLGGRIKGSSYCRVGVEERVGVRGHLLCVPCTVRTAYDVAVRSTRDEELREKVVMEVVRWLSSLRRVEQITPAELHTEVCRIARRITGNTDPFRPVKQLSNRVAMRVLPTVRRRIEASGSFEEAFRIAVMGAICGNTIDFEVEGYKPSMRCLERSLLRCLGETLSIDDIEVLTRLLSKSRRVLYLLDNAGEIAFDRLLIELIVERYPLKLWAVVKEGPILNDATVEDALQVDLTSIVEVVTTGNDHIGLKMEGTSERFRALLKEADLIIAKGQGYYESIPEVEPAISTPICYILRAKCSLVAESLGVHLQGNVVKVDLGGQRGVALK